jgi:hypothetical protein
MSAAFPPPPGPPGGQPSPFAVPPIGVPAIATPPRPDLPEPAPPRRPRRGRVVVAALLILGLIGLQLGALTSIKHDEPVRGEHAFILRGRDGSPIRWDPCGPIRYVVNDRYATAGALDDVREAVRRVSEATGVRFAYEGTSDRTPDQTIDVQFQTFTGGQKAYLPLLIAWVPHRVFRLDVDAEDAVAFGLPFRGDGVNADTYMSGVIAVDAGDDAPPGFDERYSRGVILMHELGHIMGLGHVDSPHEIMWSPEVDPDVMPDLFQTEWGPGDLVGLAALGRSESDACPAA